MTNCIGVISSPYSNHFSIEKAFEYLGCRVKSLTCAKDVEAVDRIVIPGVGSFPNFINWTRSHGVDKALVEAGQSGKPVLGICLGYQALFENSEETEATQGLGLVSGHVLGLRKLWGEQAKVPHIGWAEVMQTRDNVLMRGIEDRESFYFNHGFGVANADKEDAIAYVDEGAKLIAAIEQNNIFGVQFHPEKSLNAGLRVLQNFMAL